MKKVILMWIMAAATVAMAASGCQATNMGPFDPRFNWNPFKDIPAVVVEVPVPVVVEDVKELDVVPLIPKKYSDWGWTEKDYAAYLQCKASGGYMGSSKNCHK